MITEEMLQKMLSEANREIGALMVRLEIKEKEIEQLKKEIGGLVSGLYK